MDTRYSFMSVASNASIGLSIGTNAITTTIIGYKLWYVTLNVISLIQLLITKHNARTQRTTIVKSLGSKGWRGPVENILILLVESGLVYLVFQVRPLRLTHLVQLIVQWTDCGPDSVHYPAVQMVQIQ